MPMNSLSTTKVGERLPEIRFGPISRATLALYAGASGDHNAIHIDSDMAKAAGMPDVFAHGMLSFGVLARVPTEWAGVDRLRSFSARFVSMTQVHDLITCSGEVVERFDEDGEQRARIAVTATAQDGRKTLTGEAIVALDDDVIMTERG
jgi:acyl dehydratase